MIPVATSKTILCNTFPTVAKGGNVKKGLPCHDLEKALICIAAGSGWYETNTGSWALSLMQISPSLLKLKLRNSFCKHPFQFSLFFA